MKKPPHSSRLTPHLRVWICFLFLAGACSNPPETLHIAGPTMGTRYSVKIIPTDETPPEQELAEGIEAILEDINRKMSTYIEGSELSIINRTANTGWIGVSDELYEVLQGADLVSRKTGGAFDVTVGALVNLWGFGPALSVRGIPADEEIEKALEGAGYQNLELRSSPPALRKGSPAAYLDLSAIAKGYAVDKIAEFLETRRIEDYLVEIGGEIRARGVNARGEVWRIGIEKPAADRRAIQRVIGIKDIAMATSGDYRNFFMHDGKRYSHTIDPRTGRPVSHALASVTILDESAMVADALATALLVMGPVEGYRYAERAGVPALFIAGDHGELTETYTTALKPYLVE